MEFKTRSTYIMNDISFDVVLQPPVSISQEVNDRQDEEQPSTPMAPRLDPPPHVVVDTGAPKHLRKSDKQVENIRKQNRESEKHHNRNVTNQDNYSRQQNRDPDRQEAHTRQQVKDSNKHLKEYKMSNKKQVSNLVPFFVSYFVHV